MRLFLLCIFLSAATIACSDNRDLILKIAEDQIKSGYIEGAQYNYQLLLSRDKFDVDAIKGMAVCSLALSATDEAVRWSRELLQYRPWDRDANLLAGKQAAKQGDFAEAANRLILSFIDSEFKLDKEEVKNEILNLHRRIAAESIKETTTDD